MRGKSSYFSIMIFTEHDLIVVASVLCPSHETSCNNGEIIETIDTRCLYSTVLVQCLKKLHYYIVRNFTHCHEYWEVLGACIVHPFFHRTTVSKRKIISTFSILACISLSCAPIYFIWSNIARLIYSIGVSSYAAQHSSNTRYCKKKIDLSCKQC